jgi:Na+/H+-dicarboxylate symporter
VNKLTRSYFILFISILLGILTGISGQKSLMATAQAVCTLFIHFLSMIAAPIVLLSILSTLMGMRGFEQMKTLGRKVVTYTLLTTVLSAIVALGLFLALNPVASIQNAVTAAASSEPHSYMHFLIDIVPSNLFEAFLQNKVISIAFIGFLFGITSHYLPEDQRKTLQKGCSALFQLIPKGSRNSNTYHALCDLGMHGFGRTRNERAEL